MHTGAAGRCTIRQVVACGALLLTQPHTAAWCSCCRATTTCSVLVHERHPPTHLFEAIYIACTLGNIDNELCQSLLSDAGLRLKLCTHGTCNSVRKPARCRLHHCCMQARGAERAAAQVPATAAASAGTLCCCLRGQQHAPACNQQCRGICMAAKTPHLL